MGEGDPRRDLGQLDLVVGKQYSGHSSDIGDEPLNALLGVGNMGGFRAKGSIQKREVSLVALVTTFSDEQWPDSLEKRSSKFVYFGDNKKPGRDLHETSKHGNELLSWVFSSIHIRDKDRSAVPPFFVFHKDGPRRAVRFLGVAAPGSPYLSESEDLIALWTTVGNERYQNYRSVFTILDIEVATRGWIRELGEGVRTGPNCPQAWLDWSDKGEYRPLVLTD